VTKNMRQILFAAALSMTWAGDASAFDGTPTMTGAELLVKCRPIDMGEEYRIDKQSDIAECIGFIVGVYAGFRTGPQNQICIQSVTYGPFARAVVDELVKTERSSLGMPAAFFVSSTIMTLMRAYPCPETPNGKDGGW
jgi:Rap1a immunity proteins